MKIFKKPIHFYIQKILFKEDIYLENFFSENINQKAGTIDILYKTKLVGQYLFH